MSFAKEIKDTMLKRKMELLKLGKETEKNLQDAPEGTLRISRSRGRTQYYLWKRPADKGGTYISKDKKELVVKLAQKDYDQKLSEAIRREVKATRNGRVRIMASCYRVTLTMSLKMTKSLSV